MIYWLQNDKRFKPGTVSDLKNIRLELKQIKRNGAEINTWRLYLSIRTYKEDGIKNDLKRKVAVAEFKKCKSLKEAQYRAEKYYKNFINGL